MRRLILAVALVAGACGQAEPGQAELRETAKVPDAPFDPDDIAGVWQGTVGELPVLACFNADDERDFGVYYYRSKLRPIALRTAEDKPVGSFAEQKGYDDPTGPTWKVARVAGDRLEGVWRNDGKTLPIALKSVPYEIAEYGSVCGSAAFMEPRIRGWSVSESGAAKAGARYTRLDWRPGKAFDPDYALVRTFALPEEQRGDAAINRALHKVLPGDDPTHDLYDCIGSNVAQNGVDGDWEEVVEPELISREWVATIDAVSLYCGGMHPDTSQERHIYDRRSGKEVDPATFLKSGAYKLYDFGSDEPRLKAPVQYLAKPLRDVVRDRWPKENEECAISLDDGGIDIGLVRTGMVFKPDVPHVAAPCGESITVPWAELAPFLSDKGRVVRASLEK